MDLNKYLLTYFYDLKTFRDVTSPLAPCCLFDVSLYGRRQYLRNRIKYYLRTPLSLLQSLKKPRKMKIEVEILNNVYKKILKIYIQRNETEMFSKCTAN